MTSARWYALLLGLILLTYWARVIRMVIKQRKRTGRHANFVPPEPLGRAVRIIWYPTVVAWVAHPFISAYQRRPPAIVGPLLRSDLLALLGLLLAAAALVGSWICWKRMGKSWRMGIDPSETTPLIVTGPYAYVRHPIYALSSLLMIAAVLVIPSPLMLILGVIHLACLQWEARREERHLLAVNGDQYAAYRSRVGRFLPRG
ncbi:MAG TPA: isoprenylcysteine carboxylmethyltransferase family protein [Tepidisphaeraceae bacterium]|nr:isoprenylcysteine carboxylmethyltransferase family protein [Tepidisphaeraceae bacterium]